MKESPTKKLSSKMKLEIVLAGMFGGNISKTCEKFNVSRRQFYRWKDKFFNGEKEPLKSPVNISDVGLNIRKGNVDSLKYESLALEKSRFEYSKNQDLWDNFLRHQNDLDDSTSVMRKTTAVLALGEYYKLQNSRFPRIVHAVFKNALAEYWSKPEYGEPPEYVKAIYEVIKMIANDKKLCDSENHNIFNDQRADFLSFEGFKLMLANLNCTSFSNANFSRANLLGATISGSNFNSARFDGANLEYAKMNDASYAFASFRYAKLSFSTLWYSDFRGANLLNVDFTKAQIQNTNFTGSFSMATDFSTAEYNEKTSFSESFYTKEHAKLRDTKFPEGIDFKKQASYLFAVPDNMPY